MLQSVYEADYVTVDLGAAGEKQLVGKDLKTVIAELENKMREAAANLDFEDAARFRGETRRLEAHELGLDRPGVARRLTVVTRTHGSSSATREKVAAERKGQVAKRKTTLRSYKEYWAKALLNVAVTPLGKTPALPSSRSVPSRTTPLYHQIILVSRTENRMKVGACGLQRSSC